MSTHPFKADYRFMGACAEGFGGPARCGLPLENPVHTPTDAPPDETVVVQSREAIGYTVRDTPMWEKAVHALRTDGEGWNNGPYPFRKYVINDDGGGGALFEQCLKMLLFSGVEFWVDCRRGERDGEEQPYREALVTYGRFASMPRQTIAAELETDNE